MCKREVKSFPLGGCGCVPGSQRGFLGTTCAKQGQLSEVGINLDPSKVGITSDGSSFREDCASHAPIRVRWKSIICD